jgi:uroporphyrinogen III methyltransferase/synthase
LGGDALLFPTIEIVPPRSYEPLDEAIRRIESYHWVIFTSVNGVKSFSARLRELGLDLPVAGSVKIAAIGPETAKAAESVSLSVALVPREFRAEAILEEIAPGEMAGKRVLIPRASVARDVLPQTLRKWGAQVDVVEAYRTEPARANAPWLRGLLMRREIHMVTFTSPSTANCFAAVFKGESLKELLAHTAVASIGPITCETLEAMGIRVDVVPQEYTIVGLTRAIVEYFERQ